MSFTENVIFSPLVVASWSMMLRKEGASKFKVKEKAEQSAMYPMDTEKGKSK